MGVTDNVMRSRMLEFVKQEGKHLSQEQILSLLQDFVAHPEKYKQHANPRWRALAELLQPEEVTQPGVQQRQPAYRPQTQTAKPAAPAQAQQNNVGYRSPKQNQTPDNGSSILIPEWISRQNNN